MGGPTMRKSFVVAFLMFLVNIVPAQEVVPDAWFGVSVGLTSVDAQVGYYDLLATRLQVGYYDLLATRLHGRVIASYTFWGAFAVNADVLLSTGRQSGFFVGLGTGVAADGSYLAFGPDLVIGGDIPIDDRSGVSLEASVGFYAYTVYSDVPSYPDVLVPPYPVFGRLSAGYRRSF